MTRSVSSGNRFLIRCSISMCGKIRSLWHLRTFVPWFHAVCLCVTSNSVWAHLSLGLNFILFHPLLQIHYSLFISAISSICLHVLHALLIVIKEYSPIREMPSILFRDIRSLIHQKSAVKMSCNKWRLTLLLKNLVTSLFQETSAHL